MTRVAALQFASGTNVEDNLATCLRMIDSASEHGPDLMVLPEFSNHISWYDDAVHARAVSVDIDGPFLKAIGERASQYGCHIVINVSLRRDGDELTISSLMYGPQGELLAVADKQTLMGHENFWFTRATRTSEVVETPMGRLAMFPCRDGVTCETPRGLALRGAQLFCDSLNSFALDEASLHVPVRAPENRVFLVAANKVGPLIPEALIASVAAETHIPERFLYGAGESQVVDPRGNVLARGPGQGEAVVWADVELGEADNKLWPDGTDAFRSRRPDLYTPIADPPVEVERPPAASSLSVALLCPSFEDESALDELPALLAGLPGDISMAVLPELFYRPGIALVDPLGDAAAGQRAIQSIIASLASRPAMTIVTSVVMEAEGHSRHTAVLIGAEGVIAVQPQLHPTLEHGWSVPGESLNMVDLPWGRLAMICGRDVMHPELIKVAVIQGADVIAVPFRLREAWEAELALPSRAAENRVCVVAASRPHQGAAGLIASLERDFTLMTEWADRAFDGYINQPILTAQEESVTTATIHPQASRNKLMSAQTDLILDRPWKLSGGLTTT